MVPILLSLTFSQAVAAPSPPTAAPLLHRRRRSGWRRSRKKSSVDRPSTAGKVGL